MQNTVLFMNLAQNYFITEETKQNSLKVRNNPWFKSTQIIFFSFKKKLYPGLNTMSTFRDISDK